MERQTEEEPEQEYARVLTIAKEALKYIGVFRTPPTPGIYDVWYRYVEGSDVALHETLAHAVTVSKSVSKELLEYCHQQRIAELSGAENLEAVSNKLVYEISSLTSLLSVQLKATACIEEEVLSVASAIQDVTPTPQMIRKYVEQLVASNEAMRMQLTSTREQMEQSQAQVSQLKTNLIESQKALLTDSLTGIGNRRFCQSAMKHAVMQRQDDGAITYLMLIDLDNLKAINEAYGHAVGDDLLKHVSQTLSQSLGSLLPGASLGRLASDDFVVILKLETHEAAVTKASLIREQFAGRSFVSDRIGERLKQVSVSIGAALLRETDDEVTWIDRAQKLLHSAKQSGGNQVMIERVI